MTIIEITEKKTELWLRLKKSWKTFPKLYKPSFPCTLRQDDYANCPLQQSATRHRDDINPIYKTVR